jgi:hypothetical protein
MEAKPAESETISVDPATEFRKGKAKREAKRKEVKVITEYVPPLPESTKVPEPEPEPKVPEPEPEPKVSEPEPEPKVSEPPVIDVDSIAERVAEKLFGKMAVEKVDMDKTPEVKTPPKPKRAPKEKKVKTPPPPPPTKYFGWC